MTFKRKKFLAEPAGLYVGLQVAICRGDDPTFPVRSLGSSNGRQDALSAIFGATKPSLPTALLDSCSAFSYIGCVHFEALQIGDDKPCLFTSQLISESWHRRHVTIRVLDKIAASVPDNSKPLARGASVQRGCESLSEGLEIRRRKVR